MKPEEILSYEPKVLSQEQREFYFVNGYLQLESFVGQDWLDRLWTVTNRLIEESRKLSKSDKVFDIEPILLNFALSNIFCEAILLEHTQHVMLFNLNTFLSQMS